MKLTDFQTNNLVKMLIIGDSGTGKTGALASLAIAGYKVRIIDFDKGIQSLYEALKQHCGGDEGKLKAVLENVEYQPLSDPLQVVAGNVIPKGVPTSVPNALKLCEYWGPKSVPGATDLGDPSTWGKDCVLVLDSLTHFSNAAMRYIQVLSGNQGKNPTQPEWGNAQRLVEQLLTLLYSDQFKTNVIVIGHVIYDRADNAVDDKGQPIGDLKGNPMSLGRALPPKIPSYFNTMLLMKTKGTGQFTKRVLTTTPDGVINTKSPILSGIPSELPIETGLGTYFDFALGKRK